jgi:Family of unknown function (DUF6232)
VRPVSLTTRTPAPRGANPFVVRSRPAGALYREGDVLVTYEYFEVGGRRYRVAELDSLHTASGGRSLQPWLLVAGGALLAALGVGLTLLRQPGVPGSATYLALLAAVALPGLAAAVTGRSRNRRELCGRYRGTTVRLYVTSDTRRFGQLTRALLRAYEASNR